MEEHKLSLTSAILFNINIMIGSGILVGPAVIAGIAGNAGFISYFIMALCFLPMVLCMVQLSRMFPGEGGFYTYVSSGLGKTWGYVAGWLYFAGYTFTTAVDLVGLRDILVSAIGENWLTQNSLLFNAIILTAFCCLNLLSLRILSKFFNFLTIFKLIPVLTLIILIPFFITFDFPITGQELSMIPASFPLVIFSYFGFEYAANLSHLIKDGEKNAPLAISLGFLITAVIYTLFMFGLLNLMGKENLVTYGASGYANFLNLPVPGLKTGLLFLIPLASIFTLIASTNGVLNANSIMMQSMANHDTLRYSKIFGLLNKVHRPWVAILIQGLVTFFLVSFIPNINTLGSLCAISVFMAFVLAFVSLLKLKLNKPVTQNLLIILAIAISFGLVIYSVYDLGHSIHERLMYMIPVICAWIIGWIFKNNSK